MDAQKKIREHVSAFGDGEVARTDLELAAAALRTEDGALAWVTYHRIGDALRAQAAPEFSSGFNERLAARLAAEPLPLRRSSAAAAAPSAAAVPATGAAKMVTAP